MTHQIDINEMLGDIASNGPLLNTHRRRIEEIMRHFHKAGLTIKVCSDARHLNRDLSTVKGYARDFKLAFPDYVPLSMRPPKPPKTKRLRKAA